MSITTYAELQTVIAGYLARSDLTTEITDFIRLAETRLRRDLRIRQMLTSTTLTCTSGTATVTNNYQISVETLVPTAQTGKTIVDAIQQFESRSGSSSRFSAVVMA